MVNTNELKAAIVRKGMTQRQVAKSLGISERTLGNKMKNGVFLSDEIERMIVLLDINDPLPIFFSSLVS